MVTRRHQGLWVPHAGRHPQSIRGLYVSGDRNYNYNYLGVRGFSRPGDYNTSILLLVDGYRINDNVYDQATIGKRWSRSTA